MSYLDALEDEFDDENPEDPTTEDVEIYDDESQWESEGGATIPEWGWKFLDESEPPAI